MLSASFIIINYNGKKFLHRLLNSLFVQDNQSFEIIIIDNGSTDNSINFITKNFPSIKLIKSLNVGYGQGCNIGAKYAIGKFLFFLNPDIYLPDNFLSRNLSFYRKKNKLLNHPIGCITSIPLNFNSNPSVINYNSGGIIDIFGTPQRKSKPEIFDNSFVLLGACLTITRQLFNKIKGFNPNFFLYGEEIDLCWRLKIFGYQNLIDKNNHFFHLGGGSNFGRNRPKQVALMTYGCFIDSITNYQTITLLFLLPLYLVYLLSLLLFLPFFKNLNFNYTKELLFAFRQFLKDYNKIFKFRNFVQKNRTVTDWQLRKYISLIPSILSR